MKIIVLVKEVPDTYGHRKLDLETGLSDRAASGAVLDEIGERALEVALTYADNNPDAEIIVLSVGPDTVPNTLRKALGMGAATAVHVVDEALRGADLGLTGEVLAAAIHRTGFDLVIAGNLSTDGSGGVVPSIVAELLGVPAATNLSSVKISEGSISGVREVEKGSMEVTANLPAVVSITEALPEGRFPNFKGIMAAKRKPIETLTLRDLGVDADNESKSRSIVVAVSELSGRQAGVKVIDEGNAANQLADFLIQNRLA